MVQPCFFVFLESGGQCPCDNATGTNQEDMQRDWKTNCESVQLVQLEATIDFESGKGFPAAT